MRTTSAVGRVIHPRALSIANEFESEGFAGKILESAGSFELLLVGNRHYTGTNVKYKRRDFSAPFFFHDAQHTFFFEPELGRISWQQHDECAPVDDSFEIQPKVDEEIGPKIPGPGPVEKVDPAGVFTFVTELDWMDSDSVSISLDGTRITAKPGKSNVGWS